MSDSTELTAREIEVLKLTARGLSLSAIGKRLGISAGTAKNHRANLMGKLGLHSANELTHYAIAKGLIEASPVGMGEKA